MEAVRRVLVLVPLLGLYFLVQIESLADVTSSVGFQELGIEWETVTPGQWYAFWLLAALYVSIGLVGVYFLRRAFLAAARGGPLDRPIWIDIRRFAVLFFLQSIVSPLHAMVASYLLSMNHPPGQGVIALSLGSEDLSAMALGLVIWSISALLLASPEKGVRSTAVPQFGNKKSLHQSC